MKSFGFSKDKIYNILKSNSFQKGLFKYLAIMNLLNETDVSLDRLFQRKFNGFYRMRQRNSNFYNKYFIFMESHKKDKNLSFSEIATYLFVTTNRCEISFSSKLLATINPNMPVWDKIVALNHFGISISYYVPKKYNSRLDMIIDKYNQFYLAYLEYMNSDEANLIIKLFRELYPNIVITDIKIVDLVLWQDR